MYCNLREKFEYLFMREESELKDMTRPDWMFKYLRDQWDTISMRSSDEEVGKVFYRVYIQSIERLVVSRYMEYC